uniref:Uncharacterized protein n=1 Tax=Ignisphaera aggregans TaxID=334771 RepID=A0A7J2U1L0_9CREN
MALSRVEEIPEYEKRRTRFDELIESGSNEEVKQWFEDSIRRALSKEVIESDPSEFEFKLRNAVLSELGALLRLDVDVYQASIFERSREEGKADIIMYFTIGRERSREVYCEVTAPVNSLFFSTETRTKPLVSIELDSKNLKVSCYVKK